MAGPAVLILSVESIPLIIPNMAISDASILTDVGFIMVGTIVLMAALMLFGRNSATLDIDQSGIKLETRKLRYFYNWENISHISAIPGAVRIDVKGHSETQNRLNLISARFGIDPEDLAAALRDGLAQWGERPAPVAFDASPEPEAAIDRMWRLETPRRSVAPGDGAARSLLAFL